MSLINKTTLVIGKSTSVDRIIKELSYNNLEYVVHTNDSEIIASCKGAFDSFQVTFKKNKTLISKTFSNIIIAEEALRKSNFSSFGLEESKYVKSLSKLNEFNDIGNFDIVFLTGIFYESSPVILGEIMKASIYLQLKGVHTYILTKNLKVAGNGLEALYRETKEAGTIYFKFTNNFPKILQKEDGKAEIEFIDEISNIQFNLKPKLTIIDEIFYPSNYLKELSKIFRLHTDENGFIQTENVHRLSVFTNRKGIFAYGSSRGIFDKESQIQDINIVVSNIIELNKETITIDKDFAEINTNNCVRCLTCYRICPYRAVVLNYKPEISSKACEGCSLCVVECPRQTIQMKHYKRPDIINDNSPFIVAFCCKRSAIYSKENMLNIEIIEVPCTAGISIDYVLYAFKQKAAGVIIMACHEGNCHLEFGNIYAHNRMSYLLDSIQQIGINKKRLAFKNISANMRTQFFNIINDFLKELKIEMS